MGLSLGLWDPHPNLCIFSEPLACYQRLPLPPSLLLHRVAVLSFPFHSTKAGCVSFSKCTDEQLTLRPVCWPRHMG